MHHYAPAIHSNILETSDNGNFQHSYRIKDDDDRQEGKRGSFSERFDFPLLVHDRNESLRMLIKYPYAKVV